MSRLAIFFSTSTWANSDGASGGSVSVKSRRLHVHGIACASSEGGVALLTLTSYITIKHSVQA